MVEFKKNDRGFKIYGELVDSKGSSVRVQESSAACEHCVWIFADNDPGIFKDPSPHLTVPQAIELITCLEAFVQDSEERYGMTVGEIDGNLWEQSDPSQINDGVYDGLQTGYSVVFQVGERTYQFNSSVGVRGINTPCKVIANNGSIEVR